MKLYIADLDKKEVILKFYNAVNEIYLKNYGMHFNEINDKQLNLIAKLIFIKDINGLVLNLHFDDGYVELNGAYESILLDTIYHMKILSGIISYTDSNVFIINMNNDLINEAKNKINDNNAKLLSMGFNPNDTNLAKVPTKTVIKNNFYDICALESYKLWQENQNLKEDIAIYSSNNTELMINLINNQVTKTLILS
ncbi:MAG: hypothetical protein IJ572_03900 [Bacilli bacterium]|nr:hypothetical protein [Bacilli bacterium]